MLNRGKVGFGLINVVAAMFVIVLALRPAMSGAQPTVNQAVAAVVSESVIDGQLADTSLNAATEDSSAVKLMPWDGDDVREQSLNWADYTASTAEETTALRPFEGEQIYQQSLNWADYAPSTTVQNSPLRPFEGEQIYQQSLNWADYTVSATGQTTSLRPFEGEEIYQQSLNWADYTEMPQPILRGGCCSVK